MAGNTHQAIGIIAAIHHSRSAVARFRAQALRKRRNASRIGLFPALPDNQHPLRRQQRVRARALNALNLRQPLGLLRRYDSALRQTVRKIPRRIPSGLARQGEAQRPGAHLQRGRKRITPMRLRYPTLRRIQR